MRKFMHDLGIAARGKQMTHAVAVKTFVIRCGTPDCDWGKNMSDLGEEQLRLCYSEFRKHCIQRHDLQEWDTTPHVHLDLEH